MQNRKLIFSISLICILFLTTSAHARTLRCELLHNGEEVAFKAERLHDGENTSMHLKQHGDVRAHARADGGNMPGHSPKLQTMTVWNSKTGQKSRIEEGVLNYSRGTTLIFKEGPDSSYELECHLGR